MEKIEYKTDQERTSIMDAKLAEGLHLLEDRRENEFHEKTREVISFKDFLVFMTDDENMQYEKRQARTSIYARRTVQAGQTSRSTTDPI